MQIPPSPLDKVGKNYIIREIYFISWGIAKRVRSIGKVVGESLLTALPKNPRNTQMKEGIHPRYVEMKVTCGCGNTFVTRGTQPEMKVDICSACHPFYTGRLKYVDTAGRIEKFNNKFSGNYASLKRGKKQNNEAAE